jgi:Putative beta-barrel porin-2, OmpL-like. bbp2
LNICSATISKAIHMTLIRTCIALETRIRDVMKLRSEAMMHNGSFPIVPAILLVLAPSAVSFLLWVLYHFHLESKRSKKRGDHVMEYIQPPTDGSKRTPSKFIASGIAIAVLSLAASAQTVPQQGAAAPEGQVGVLEKKVENLQTQLEEVIAQLKALRAEQAANVQSSVPAAAPPDNAQAQTPVESPKQEKAALLPASSTLNFTFDGYYGYNLNHPVGRVNSLRAYDVLSNSFSLNQAAVIFELPTDVANGRRFGTRIDLQFGQAAATLQGNSANENRPDIYRNIFQAYGRYVAPVGKGLTVDFGKWASSLGYEANYTKDQLNYTRSFFFYYLPFYHMGFRTNYPINDKITVNYWLTNGTQQTEPFNSFKDEMFGFNVTPTKTVNWTVNYYLGQEHPDVTPSTNCGTAPLQPGLCFSPIPNPPNGKTHIFDTYVSWQATPRFLLGGEADYVIQRLWADAGPGRSSAPSHVDGGAVYTNFQFTPRSSLALRGEYLSDRGGLFSGTTQALKETTGTYTHHLGNGFEALLEYRRDWSNHNFFPRGTAGVLVNHQDTATVGLVWWYGGKQGAW